MKKTKLALAVAAASLVSTSAFATNGTNMVGLGAQSAALGGTGVAAYYGAENVVVNPGLIGKAEGTEFSFGGTLFKPSVKNSTDMGPMNMSGTSDADTFLIPTVSLVDKINDNWTFGIGMYGTSGMGVDYDMDMGGGAEVRAQSNLQIMRFVPTIAFNQDNFGVGFSPIIQYGSLDISYDMTPMQPPMANPIFDGVFEFGTGAADDLGLGFSLGGYFDINDDLTVALSYTSEIEMKYKNQITGALDGFGGPGASGMFGFNDKLSTPAEVKLGVAYQMGKMTYSFDAKQIKWEDAKGFKDFGWENQNVFSLGFKYTDKNYWAGVGYNRGDDPIKKQTADDGMGGAKNAMVNMFNNMMFPAITTTHVTLGGGYNLTKAVAIDAAVVYAPEEKKTVDLSAMMGQPAGSVTNTTKHSQMAYTINLRYNF